MTVGQPVLYGIAAQFTSEEDLTQAARRLVGEGFREIDAFSPYPIEGLAGIIKREKSKAPLWMR